MRGPVADHQGPSTALDLKKSSGKYEQETLHKKPQFATPKISLTKVKLDISHTHLLKVEPDTTIPKIERDDDHNFNGQLNFI